MGFLPRIEGFSIWGILRICCNIGICCSYRRMEVNIAGQVAEIIHNIIDAEVVAMLLFIFAMEALGITLIGLLPTLRDALSIGALYSMLGFSLSGFTYPQMSMLAPVKALTYLEPLRHYYLIYVNEALMAGNISNTIHSMLALTAFMLISLTVAPRLHRALINQNYPLK